MNEILVWSSYFISTAFALTRLFRIDFTKLNFADGLLMGALYYLAAPMLFALFDGEIPGQFIQAAPYRPFQNLDTTLTIVGALIAFGCFQMAFGSRRPARPVSSTVVVAHTQRYVAIFVAIYLGTSVASFFIVGMNDGGHWHENVRAAMSENGFALVLKHVANFSRTAVFAVLLFACINRHIKVGLGVAIGAAIVFSDLFLTFNRISAVYFAFMLVILLRKHPRVLLLAGVLGPLLLAPVSNLWPMFRGVALVRGYNIESFIYAVGFVARNTVSSTDTLSVQLNGVFESVNIVVLNYVVENAGQAFPFQYGSMAVRAFTFFLPSTIWAGRPEGFGVLLGRTINDATSGVAFNSTMLGEAYGNFGSFWPIFLFLLLWVFHLMFKLLGNGRPVVGFVAAFCAIAMWRFDVTFATVNVFFLLMILVAMRQANQLTATIRLRRTPVSAGATQSQQ